MTFIPVFAAGLSASPGFDWVNITSVDGVLAGSGKAKSRSPGAPRVTWR